MRRYYFTHFKMVPTNNGEGSGNDTTTPNPPATYTKEQVDQLIAQETQKIKKQNDQTIAQLQTLQKSQSLTAKEKAELEDQINQLRAQTTSKEELARQEIERRQKQYDEERTGLTSERDHWRGQYEGYRLQTEILTAAAGANAYNPEQLVQLLLPKTKLVEQKEVVGGVEQTTYVPFVKFSDRDKDGKPVVLELSIGDAIKRMRELPETYGNLFKSDAKGGTGLLNTGGSPAGKSAIRPGMSQEEYMKIRGQLGFGAKIR